MCGKYHIGFRAHPAAILQHGGRQDAAGHLGHLITYAELELLDKWVSIIISAPHLGGEKRQVRGKSTKSQEGFIDSSQDNLPAG